MVMMYLKKFLMMQKTNFRKFTMIVMTYLKSLCLCRRHTWKHEGKDIIEKVSDDANDIVEDIHDDGEDIIKGILEENFDDFTQL